MKKFAYLLVATPFLLLLPFLLFLVIFSANQNGNATEFEPSTPQEQVALEIAQFVQAPRRDKSIYGCLDWKHGT